MRCIETTVMSEHLVVCLQINYNMRCIETGRDQNKDTGNGRDKLQHEMY